MVFLLVVAMATGSRLFVTADGPMIFCLRPCTIKKNIKFIILKHGGKCIQNKFKASSNDKHRLITLAVNEKEVTSGDCYDVNYILDCNKHHELLPLENYKFNLKVETTTSGGGGRNKYTKLEDKMIIEHVVKNKFSLKGAKFWRLLEYEKEFKENGRTWQSLRDRYLKQLKPSNSSSKDSDEPISEGNQIASEPEENLSVEDVPMIDDELNSIGSRSTLEDSDSDLPVFEGNSVNRSRSQSRDTINAKENTSSTSGKNNHSAYNGLGSRYSDSDDLMIIESKYDEQSIAERKETINVEENMSTTSDKDIEMGSILDTAYENIDLSSIYSENSSVLPMTPSRQQNKKELFSPQQLRSGNKENEQFILEFMETLPEISPNISPEMAYKYLFKFNGNIPATEYYLRNNECQDGFFILSDEEDIFLISCNEEKNYLLAKRKIKPLMKKYSYDFIMQRCACLDGVKEQDMQLLTDIL